MKPRKHNAKFRAAVDGKTWKFEWSVSGECLYAKELGKRTKWLVATPQMIIDCAKGQMVFDFHDANPRPTA